MPLLGDYHTHTVYSHGHGSIEDNVVAAINLGLKEIAITDHGFLHKYYGVRRMDLPNMIEDVKSLRIKYPEIKIYLGLESNLIDSTGRVDILDSDNEWLDVLICGYHKCTKASSTKELLSFNLPNFISGLTKFSTKQMVRNTDAYLKALERYPIDIISHPNYGIKTDVKEIAKAAAHYGTYLELNGKKVSMSDEEIESILDVGCDLIIDSDAHSAKKVGNFDVPLSFVDRLSIPKERIANFDKLPKLRRHREKSDG